VGLQEEWAQFAAPLEAQRDELRGIGGPEREAIKVRETLRFRLIFLLRSLLCLLAQDLRRKWNGTSLKLRCQCGHGIAIQGRTVNQSCSSLERPARRARRGIGRPGREAMPRRDLAVLDPSVHTDFAYGGADITPKCGW
jgi:hypothetical protein